MVSLRGNSALSATVSDGMGNFTVNVPAAPQQGDGILVIAASADASGKLRYLVSNPNLGAGTFPTTTAVTSPSVWAWAWPASALPSNHELHISAAQGSGAARVFDYLRYAWGGVE